MVLNEVVRILEAEVLCGAEKLDTKVYSACASDLMSDVLAFGREYSLLLTGLIHQQVIRTAEMMDIECVCFVRNKRPDSAIVDLAREKGVAVLRTPFLMFEASGRLYSGGFYGKEKGDG